MGGGLCCFEHCCFNLLRQRLLLLLAGALAVLCATLLHRCIWQVLARRTHNLARLVRRCCMPQGEGGGAAASADEAPALQPEVTIQAGCTAVVALIVRDRLFVANAGDSRAVLCRGGKALPMSGTWVVAWAAGRFFLCCALLLLAHAATTSPFASCRMLHPLIVLHLLYFVCCTPRGPQACAAG